MLSKVVQRLIGVYFFIQTLLEGVNGQCPAGGEESYQTTDSHVFSQSLIKHESCISLFGCL